MNDHLNGHLVADPASIDGDGHLLVEIAGLLQAGRLDQDLGTLARSPRSHPDVAARVQEFAELAHDEQQDLVLLLAALATKLRTAAYDYLETDLVSQTALDHLLATGQYLAPEDR